MKIINFATENHVGLENLKLSIEKAGGWEQIRIGTDIKWQGWITRMKEYKKYCQELKNQDEIIVLSDAYDVLCLRSSIDFLSLYNQYAQNKIIIGAEIGCHPGNCVAPNEWWNENNLNVDFKHIKKGGGIISEEGPRFVNGGLIAGPAKKLSIMWEWALNEKFSDDQIALGNYTNQFPQEIFLDVDSNFFFNDYNATAKYILNEDNSISDDDGKMKTPFFIHFHGLTIGNFIPFNNQKTLFDVGKNYKTVGKKLNGNDHINSFPTDSKTNMAVWIERSVFYLLIFIFLTFLAILFFHKQK